MEHRPIFVAVPVRNRRLSGGFHQDLLRPRQQLRCLEESHSTRNFAKDSEWCHGYGLAICLPLFDNGGHIFDHGKNFREKDQTTMIIRIIYHRIMMVNIICNGDIFYGQPF